MKYDFDNADGIFYRGTEEGFPARRTTNTFVYVYIEILQRQSEKIVARILQRTFTSCKT